MPGSELALLSALLGASSSLPSFPVPESSKTRIRKYKNEKLLRDKRPDEPNHPLVTKALTKWTCGGMTEEQKETVLEGVAKSKKAMEDPAGDLYYTPSTDPRVDDNLLGAFSSLATNDQKMWGYFLKNFFGIVLTCPPLLSEKESERSVKFSIVVPTKCKNSHDYTLNFPVALKNGGISGLKRVDKTGGNQKGNKLSTRWSHIRRPTEDEVLAYWIIREYPEMFDLEED